MTQVEQPIATVDDCNVELLLSRPTEDRLGDCSKVSGCLHSGALRWPPGGEFTCCRHSASDKLGGVFRHASAQQPIGDVPLDEPLWSLNEGDQVDYGVSRAAMREQRIECANEPLIAIALLRAHIAGDGCCQGETHWTSTA
jgi:hypothetical protein